MDLSHLADKALELGAIASAVIDSTSITYASEFRASCESNYCGNSGRCWTCPPAVGPMEDLIAEVAEYPKGVLLQTSHQLEDSLDIEGMINASSVHEDTFRRLFDYIEETHSRSTFLPLSVGCCSLCKPCTYTEAKPCRFPDKARSSLEAYCMDVSDLLTKHDIPYHRGPNTVSYVALFLFRDQTSSTG